MSTHLPRTALIAALCALGLLAFSASAFAAAPVWNIASVSNTTAALGDNDPFTVEHTFQLELRNEGDAEAEPGVEPITFHAHLPAAIEAVSLQDLRGTGWECPPLAGLHDFSCNLPTNLPSSQNSSNGFLSAFALRVSLEPSASGIETAAFSVGGGGGAPATTVDPLRISATPPPFGLANFDAVASAGSSGALSTQAAGHPYGLTTGLEFNTLTDPAFLKGEVWPAAPARDAVVSVPPGLLGDPTSFARCTVVQLAHGALGLAEPECPLSSQVGVASIFVGSEGGHNELGSLPVFNMQPAFGEPFRLGFNAVGVPVLVSSRLRSDSDYGVDLVSQGISQGLAFSAVDVTVWGSPSDPRHDLLHACSGKQAPWEGEKPCPAPPEPAFLRMPTSCTASGQGLPWRVQADSWAEPGAQLRPGVPDPSDPAWVSSSIETHQLPAFPAVESEWGERKGTDGCAAVPFNPSFSATPTTDQADSPSGLSVDLTIPQQALGDANAIAQSDLRRVAVKLPAGMSVNPSSAAGLGACSSAQIGLATALGATPVHFDTEPEHCPESSKLGTVEIETPLLDHSIAGQVFLAKQTDNPFKSLLALYLAIEDPETGTVVKLAGHIDADPASGRLETVFDENPQVPFEHFSLDLFGGSHAPLRTPAACGTFATRSVLTPWSGNPPVTLDSGFEITSGPGGGACPNSGFDPHLSAGTQNPLAGSYSPFSLRLTRADGSQEIAGLDETLAEGLIGAPKGIPYCPDSVLAAFPVETVLGTGATQEAHPSCPAASQVGTVTVGAGAGATPFYTSSGRAYLAGPYKGAPLSIAVLAPAVAGPFDLGTVLVRNAVHVDPETAQVSVSSDPLPTILHGIPLDLRDVRVDLNRPNFTLNPTSCEPQAITSKVTSAQGALAHPSSPFQAASCERLGFKPKLALKLKGATGRGANPALTATLRPRVGDANAARIQVALPHSEFLAQAHIKTICTRVQFAAGSGGGAQCPSGSVYGKATATTPLLDYPLTGNVFLRSSSHKLPDLVLALHGPASQPIEVDAVGRIDSVKGGIRTSFEAVPDAPLTKVVLQMPGGKKSLLENSRNICKSTDKATVQLEAHNGRETSLNPALKLDCRGGAPRHHRRRGR